MRRPAVEGGVELALVRRAEDHLAGPIGEVILGAPYQCKLDASFHGRAAHSGMFPEEGRSAIAAAARAIADLRLGRLDDETTANVGELHGGRARNIVPERCFFTAEARSHDEGKLGELVQEMLETITFAAQLGVAYPELTGPVALGDDVVVNVQARELALGSGGFDVLHANLTRGLGLSAPQRAHVMKLPYTPVQHASRHVEEDAPLPTELGGMPVVCCSLHSQVAPACAALAGLRVAYVQVPGGALPVGLSDTVRALRARDLLAATVSVGACFGGEVESVTSASALAWAAAD